MRLIRRPTWFLRIVPYLEENDRNLAGLADLLAAVIDTVDAHSEAERLFAREVEAARRGGS